MAKEIVDTITKTNVLEAPQKNNGESFAAIVTPPKADSRIFRLSNDKRKGTVQLDLEEDVIDPATGKTRRMRVLRGAQSIWFDEQPPTVFPPDYVKKNVRTLDFNRGKCVVALYDHLLIKAAELSNRNTGNKNKQGHKDIYFYEWNPTEMSAKAMQDEEEVIKAMGVAFNSKMDEIIPHAQYLGLSFQDEMGQQLNPDAIRASYIKTAKNHAKRFLTSLHSPTVQIAHKIRKASAEGKIDLGRQPGAAYWTDGGFITALPEGRDAIDFLIEFAMLPGDTNAAFANQLREMT